jgi:multiple sugar transport system substrate-binding protein
MFGGVLMKKTRKKVGFILLALILLLTGCLTKASTEDPDSQNPQENETATPTEEEAIELTLWAWYGGWDDVIAEFNKKYPNVTIKVETSSYGDQATKYLGALAGGTVPDIMVIDSEYFGQFTSIAGLEDLRQSPYNAEKYKADFNPGLWNNSLSWDRSKLIAFPFASSPFVTYYRADIMEKYGFPSEPEELAKYMEDPANWLKIAETLRKDNIFITQWDNEVVRLYERSQTLFDQQFQLQRNNEDFIKALDLGKTVNQKGLDANVDVWTNIGADYVKDGKLAMLYLGTWGTEQIKAWAPESAGNWRMTRLPFGLNGWLGSTVFTLPSQSEHKEMAWKFIEFYTTEYSINIGLHGSTPAYLPALSNPYDINKNGFLGGQITYNITKELAKTMQPHLLTPIDTKANSIWYKGVLSGIERDDDSKKIIDGIENDLISQLGKDIEILLQSEAK